MKKLLLAFSLIAIFGIGITTASITFPEKTNNTNKKESTEKNRNAQCCKNSSSKKNDKDCCERSN